MTSLNTFDAIIDNLDWIHKRCKNMELIDPEDMVLNTIPKAIGLLREFEKQLDNTDKLRIKNSELIQRIQKLEKELSKERAYNYAIVTVIKNNYPT